MLYSSYMIVETLLRKISYDIGIDLGTATLLVYVKHKGLLINEPSVIALHKKTRQVLAVGSEAQTMLGKTPPNIQAIRPLRHGVISDFKATEELLSHFIHVVNTIPTKFPKYPKPRVVIGIPSGLTAVERKAVVDSTLTAGARKVYLVEEPMAAAIGAGLPVKKATGSMIVDIGGGTTEIAIISLGGVVASRSFRVAGDRLDHDIVAHARKKYNLLLGERKAEHLKRSYGTALDSVSSRHPDLPDKIVLQGRDLKTGLPRSIQVPPSELRDAMKGSIDQIINAVKEVLEASPADIMPDILSTGITLAGGTSLLRGLDRLMSSEINTSVRVAQDPVSCVARGCGYLLSDDNLLDLVGSPK
jgi:rod shape-determining protein MreB and related proteins